jgi:hypothetical protein
VLAGELDRRLHDVPLSASRCATKRRGDFARLLADLGARRFGADLLEDAAVKVFVTTHNRLYDLANRRGDGGA